MNVYLAGSFNRRKELKGYISQLGSMGLTVTSRWLDRDEAVPYDTETDQWPYFARQDIEDMQRSSGLIVFTNGKPGRGGKDWETGYMHARTGLVVVVGPVVNVFHALYCQFDTFQDLVEHWYRWVAKGHVFYYYPSKVTHRAHYDRNMNIWTCEEENDEQYLRSTELFWSQHSYFSELPWNRSE